MYYIYITEYDTEGEGEGEGEEGWGQGWGVLWDRRILLLLPLAISVEVAGAKLVTCRQADRRWFFVFLGGNITLTLLKEAIDRLCAPCV